MRTPFTTPSLVLLLLALPTACASGSDDGAVTLSGAYSAGSPAEDDSEGDGTDGDGATSGQGSAGPSSASGGATSDGSQGGDDSGDPACCSVSPAPGCGSPQTESCVCTSEPACCQQVWGSSCVELAIACGDPYCAEDSDGAEPGTDTGVELECDGAFAFIPGNPAPGVPFQATFSDPVGLTWVGMWAEGPDGQMIEGAWGGVTGSFVWTYGFAGMAAGVWTLTFTHRETENGPDLVRGVCQKQF